MAFWRTWVRALLGASGVTLLVPAGLLVALGLATTLGGGGLGGLSQLVSGPGLPGVEAAAPVRNRESVTVPGSVPELPVATGGARFTGANARGHTTASTRNTTRPAGRRRKAQTPPRSQKPSSRPRPPVTTTTPPPATTPTPAPAPKPVNPLRRITDAAEATIATLPVVGKPVADAVGTVVDLLLPPPAR